MISKTLIRAQTAMSWTSFGGNHKRKAAGDGNSDGDGFGDGDDFGFGAPSFAAAADATAPEKRRAPAPAAPAAAASNAVRTRSALHTATSRRVSEVLVTDPERNGSGGGLPLPPLIELITEYATESRVSTWFSGAEFGERTVSCVTAYAPTGAGGGEAAIWVATIGNRIVRCDVRTALVQSAGTPDGFIAGGLCADVTRPQRVYALLTHGVAQIDVQSGAAITIQSVCTFDSPLSGSTWDETTGMAISRDGESLFVVQSGVDAEAVGRVHRTPTRPPGSEPKSVIVSSGALLVGARSVTCGPTALYVACRGRIATIGLENRTHAATVLPVPATNGAGGADVAVSDMNILSLVCLSSGWLLASDAITARIYSINPTSGVVKCVAGVAGDASPFAERTIADGDPLIEASFDTPSFAAVESAYALAVSDFTSDKIRKVPLPEYVLLPASA